MIDPQKKSRHLRRSILFTAFSLLAAHTSLSQSSPVEPSGITLQREGRVIAIQPYAPNIVRITLTRDPAQATAAPGYGISASPAAAGWTHKRDASGQDILHSSALTITLPPANATAPRHLPLDKLNNELRGHFFFGYGHDGGSFNDTVLVTTASGHPLLDLQHWSMHPNASNATATRPSDAGSHISAEFASPAGEHYYGLGQQQQGWLDLRDHSIRCWHDYNALGGENVCVPFMLSSRGYGLVWDNPSRTTIDLGFNGKNVWSSDIGDRVSFFVIAGATTDAIYQGYRQLTGITHLLPKAAYGYIQSKAIYPSQQELLDVAKTYRARHLPLDMIVVDFLNMTRQGEMDLDPKRWPDAAAMNRDLHAMGIQSLLSVWPHFSQGTQFYDMLLQRGWLIADKNGKPDRGGYTEPVGPNIDTTNPEAARWWWASIRDRYINPFGFDNIWLDETEPDVDPANDFFSIGSGARFYNVYPLFHTASVYDGVRRDFGSSRRIMLLARASYLGAQANGTVFWSSDIQATWDMLKRSIPAGLNFTASGMPYWSTDIAGFFSPQLYPTYHPQHPPLLDPSDARDVVANYDDYPELFTRWFQWGVFQPIFRTHGERLHNEVWSYGKQATPILEKYLRLRYTLMPYIYSLAYQSEQTGAPYMRALFMDFPTDPNTANLGDEYMFGPALLVAPVTDQGATSRDVYLPAGHDWYNYWTNQRFHGGQTIRVDAPIDTIPLFVRAGSILPLGSDVSSTADPQTIRSLLIYPGADTDFTLFNDDGHTYAYEEGKASLTHLHWTDATHRLTHDGATAWPGSDSSILHIIRETKGGKP